MIRYGINRNGRILFLCDIIRYREEYFARRNQMKSGLSSILLALFVIIAALPCYPETDGRDGQKRLLQKNYNVTIATDDFSKASRRLAEIVNQYDGNAMNQSINFNRNDNSGSASLQIPANKAPSFMNELGKLGTIENQNISTSDYTATFREMAAKVRLYEAMSQMNLDSLSAASNLSPEEKRLFREEFLTMVNNQLRSYRSSMESYRNYGENAQISINFRRIERAESANNSNNQPGRKADGSFTVSETPLTSNYLILFALLFILVFANSTFLLIIYRQMKRTPLGS